ncbi:MAG TPA: hypothetical protein VFM94_09700 [Solirubrobacterales bacterium]|nr:hypothetical protein [Solirubrobacterales bacterium]
MRRRREIGWVAGFVAVIVTMLAPSGAEAAKVVNGNFESGTLDGWQVRHENGAGSWFAYTGTDAPIGGKRPKPADPVQRPPQGAFAAIADQANPDALILYQDVALEAERSHQLSLLAYYDSYEPIAIPNPDTLSVADEALSLPNGKFQPNQQFRIDVIRPEAPLESLDPADVLRTVLATRRGGPQHMAPTRLTADLSAFAGQTVRIRIATAVTEEVLNAGVDAVSIATSPPGGSPGRSGRRVPILFSFGKFAASRGKGTATLRVSVSGPGLLRARGASASANASLGGPTQGRRNQIEPVTIPTAVARTVTIHLRPTPRVRAILRRRHRLRIGVAVTFMPVGGSAETATLPVVLRFAQSSK